jgi:hypothetical protein
MHASTMPMRLMNRSHNPQTDGKIKSKRIWSWSYLGHAGLKCFEFITSSNVLPHTTLISKGPVVFPFRPCRLTAGEHISLLLKIEWGQWTPQCCTWIRPWFTELSQFQPHTVVAILEHQHVETRDGGRIPLARVLLALIFLLFANYSLGATCI